MADKCLPFEAVAFVNTYTNSLKSLKIGLQQGADIFICADLRKPFRRNPQRASANSQSIPGFGLVPIDIIQNVNSLLGAIRLQYVDWSSL